MDEEFDVVLATGIMLKGNHFDLPLANVYATRITDDNELEVLCRFGSTNKNTVKWWDAAELLNQVQPTGNGATLVPLGSKPKARRD